tara:strand:+ start:687 stop:1154 length:468 start_codon:yes stop_codon:yes gene_type:complete
MTETTKITKDQGHEFTAFLNKKIEDVQYLQSVGVGIDEMVQFLRDRREQRKETNPVLVTFDATICLMGAVAISVFGTFLLKSGRQNPKKFVKDAFHNAMLPNKLDAQRALGSEIQIIKFCDMSHQKSVKDTPKPFKAKLPMYDDVSMVTTMPWAY